MAVTNAVMIFIMVVDASLSIAKSSCSSLSSWQNTVCSRHSVYGSVLLDGVDRIYLSIDKHPFKST